MNNVERILEFADELEKLVGLTRDTWFQNPIIDDTDFPGGFYCETNVVDGACVFLNTKGRGCQLHAFALKKDLDYHNLKPLVSALFPVSFHNGLLRPSDDVDDGTLICLDSGPSLYRGARTELLYYFGSDLITELDRLESKIVVPRSPK